MLLEYINKTSNFFNKFIEQELLKYKIKGLSFSHYEIIRLLSLHDSLQLKDVSKIILKHKSTVTALVEKLCKMNLVNVKKSPKDKRVSYISLTQDGKNISGIIRTIEQKTDLIFQKVLTPKEQFEIESHLKKVISL